MNALEHIAFVLSHAVEADEVSKADMRRHLGRLITASYGVNDTKALQKLSVKLGKKYRHVIHPGGVGEGEDDGL